MKKYKIQFIVLALTALATATVENLSFAAGPLTLSCKVEKEGERVDNIDRHSISFGADQGYKDLSFQVYSSKVRVSTASNMSADGKTCWDSVDQICVDTQAGDEFCTKNPHAVIYPNQGEPGDRATIQCALNGGKKQACEQNQ